MIDKASKSLKINWDDEIVDALLNSAGIAPPSAQFQGDETIEMAGLQAKRGQFTDLVHHQDLPGAQPIQRIWIAWQSLAVGYDNHFGRAVRCAPPDGA